MADLEKAIRIAKLAHKGAKDKYGYPYFKHVERVMNMGTSTEEKIVGVLHDLVEDTDWTFKRLEEQGFSKKIINALKCITKKNPHEDYEKFINRVKKNKLAIKVKLHDLTDNMDIKRMNEITLNDLTRLNKYLKAYKVLSRMVKK